MAIEGVGATGGEAVTIAGAALDAAVAHAREAAPRECCGVLIGRRRDITASFRTRNAADDPNRFLIEPADHIEARRQARGCGLEVVGFYHSHPRTDARPSPADLAEASYPGHLFLIVGLRSDPADIGLFRFEGERFLEVPFVRTP
jgi:proteasome lid subunit RPN8/RPN11